jgi:hypothetical protein
LTGKHITCKVELKGLVADEKEKKREKEGIPPDQSGFIFVGREIRDSHVFHLVLRLPRPSGVCIWAVMAFGKRTKVLVQGTEVKVMTEEKTGIPVAQQPIMMSTYTAGR